MLGGALQVAPGRIAHRDTTPEAKGTPLIDSCRARPLFVEGAQVQGDDDALRRCHQGVAHNAPGFQNPEAFLAQARWRCAAPEAPYDAEEGAC